MDDVSVPVIKGVDVLVRRACFTVVLGPSGSGKTTLLSMIGCIDKGEIIVSDCKVGELTDDELSDFRVKNIGYIFQNFNLLPVLSAYESIESPLLPCLSMNSCLSACHCCLRMQSMAPNRIDVEPRPA